MELVLFLEKKARTNTQLLAPRLLVLSLLICVCTKVWAQHAHIGDHEWPPSNLPILIELPRQFPTTIILSTDKPKVQSFFNYGLSALHSFAYLEAYRSFQQVQQLEPSNPMGAWGKAYSLLGAGKTGNELDSIIAKAIAKLEGASDIEAAYVRALAAYTRSDEDYIRALESLIEVHPEELDAKLLLAFFMNDGYNHKGQPLKNQAYAKTILQPLLKEYPNHLGLNHYWIHAVEASNYPQRAASSLSVLEKAESEFGHIIHMPGHMAWLEHNYIKAIAHFRSAEAADLKFLRTTGIGPAGYWSYFHNMAYLLVAEIEAGDLDEARNTLQRVENTYGKAATAAASSVLKKYQAEFPARLFSRAGDWKSTEKQLRSAELTHPLQKANYLHSSVAQILNNTSPAPDQKQRLDSENKLNELRNLVANSPEHAFAQTLLFEAQAINQAMNGDGKAAISNFRQAILWESKIPYEEPPLRMRTVHETAGQTFCFFGAFDAGISMYKLAIQARSNNGYAIQGLVSCLNAKGESDQAHEYQLKLDKLWARP